MNNRSKEHSVPEGEFVSVLQVKQKTKGKFVDVDSIGDANFFQDNEISLTLCDLNIVVVVFWRPVLRSVLKSSIRNETFEDFDVSFHRNLNKLAETKNVRSCVSNRDDRVFFSPKDEPPDVHYVGERKKQSVSFAVRLQNFVVITPRRS